MTSSIKKNVFAVMIFAAFFAFASVEAFACACCAEHGTYVLSTQKPSSFEFDEIKRIGFKTANIFQNNGYPDNILGIKPLGESFKATAKLNGAKWTVTITDDKNRTGKIEFAKPTSMVKYMVDQHNTPAGGEPVVYVEWRFKHTVNSMNGLFSTGFGPKVTYMLVLQGSGNMCVQAENFTHWRFEVNGKKADYAFFGDVAVS